jgi:hypothetical protein
MCFRSFVIIVFFTLILSPHLQAQTVSDAIERAKDRTNGQREKEYTEKRRDIAWE